jgi:ribosomal protein S19
MLDLRRRSEQIRAKDAGKLFAIHNGKTLIKLKTRVGMVGHKFGEFTLTRTLKKRGGATSQRKKR